MFSLKKNYSTPAIMHDEPIENGNEIEFNFDDFAITIARLVSSKKTKTPIALCVSGPWGSGKTTLLKRTKFMLDKTPVLDILTEPAILEFINDDEYPQREYRSCRTVWFNAWKYSNESELLVAFYRVLLQAMADDNLVSKLLSKMMNRFHPRRDVIKTVLSWFKISAYGVDVKIDTGQREPTRLSEKTALLDLFDDAFDSLAATWIHRTLKSKKIEPEKGVLVVFIDDLDRCLPDKMIQVLETIKLFMDKRGCIFILGADITIIQQAISKYYENSQLTGDNTKEYLDKIIQLRFELPLIRDVNMESYLMKEKIIDKDWGDSWKFLITGANINPRTVKSYINDVNLQWSMLINSNQTEGVNREDFNIWHVLTRVAPRSFLYKLKIVFIQPELRHKFVMDAIRWARQTGAPGYLEDIFAEFNSDLRFKRILQKIEFSNDFTPRVLEAFIHLSSPLSFNIPTNTTFTDSIYIETNETAQQQENPTTKNKLKVFISHASQDKPRIRELYNKLVSDGVDPWLDETNLIPGQDWQSSIQTAIDTSDAVIICLSETSVSKGGYIQKEIKSILDRALEKPEGVIYIIPVRLEPCEMPHQLRNYQWADWFGTKNEMEQSYQKILRSLRVRAYSLNREFKDLD